MFDDCDSYGWIVDAPMFDAVFSCCFHVVSMFFPQFWPLQIPPSGLRLVPAPAPFAFAWPWHPSDAQRLEKDQRELCWLFKGFCLETGYSLLLSVIYWDVLQFQWEFDGIHVT